MLSDVWAIFILRRFLRCSVCPSCKSLLDSGFRNNQSKRVVLYVYHITRAHTLAATYLLRSILYLLPLPISFCHSFFSLDQSIRVKYTACRQKKKKKIQHSTRRIPSVDQNRNTTKPYALNTVLHGRRVSIKPRGRSARTLK